MTHLRAYVIALLLATAAAASAAVVNDLRVVAQVGGRQILVADVVERLTAERRQSAATGRLDAFASGAGEAALKKLVDAKLLAIGAREEGLERRADVKRRLENLVDEFLAEQLMAEVAGRADLSERALREYYDSHQAAFQGASRVHARHLVVKTQAEAVTLVGRLKRNADFAALAREHNIDASKEKGGDLGWVSRGVMVKAFEEAVFSLPVGGLSSIVQTPFGFHIIKVEEIQAGRPKPFDSVADEVRQRVIADQVASAIAALAKKHPVTVNDAVLKSLR